MWGRWALLAAVLLYAGFLVGAPLLAMAGEAFSGGAARLASSLTQPDVVHALWLTLVLAAGSVALNTLFGVLIAWVLVRHDFWGKRFWNGLVDLPFAVSPVVAGYMLILLFGKTGWFAGFEESTGIKILFSLPGMFLATVFTSLPFVIREVMPVLQEIGTDQEMAAFTLGAGRWQTFRRVTLPGIRWGLVYGATLTLARSLGEFGAVFVVSGAVQGSTETATLYIYRALEERQDVAACGVALVLASISFLILFVLEYIKKKEKGH